MSEEEIKEYLKRTDKLLDKLSGEDKDTLEWLIFGYNLCAKMLYEKENIIKEVREYIEKNTEEKKSWLNGMPDYRLFKGDTKDLLQILDKVSDKE